jgi:hypothetical protein
MLCWCRCVDKSISGLEIPRCCQTPFSVNIFAFPKRWTYIKVHFFCGVSLFICHIACPIGLPFRVFQLCGHVTVLKIPEVKEFSSGSCKLVPELSSVTVQWKWGIFLLHFIVTLHSYAYKYQRTRRLLAGRLESLKQLTCEIMLFVNSLLSTDRHADGAS